MDKIKKILYSIIVIIQTILWIGVIAIQYLTNKKAGVMHHVYFRKYQYSNSISVENLNILSIIALIIFKLLPPILEHFAIYLHCFCLFMLLYHAKNICSIHASLLIFYITIITLNRGHPYNGWFAPRL